MFGNTNYGTPFTMPVAPVANGGYGNDGWSWIWILVILAVFGYGNGFGGFGGFGGNSGIAEAYTLNSDFATLQRQLSDGFGSVDNALDRQNAGICDLGYTALANANQTNTNIMQAQNALATQLADCCCRTQQNIKDTQYAIATTGANIQSAIKDCCCESDKQFAQTRYDMATQNCATLQQIDKAADRVIDFLCNEKTQALRDENQALRLAASQQAQNNYIISQLAPKQPVPSYIVQNPYCQCNNGYPYGFGFNGGTTIA